MYRKIGISALFLLAGTLFVFAQAVRSDKKAEKILQGVSAKYKSFKSVKATFVIHVENSKDKTAEVQKGTIYLKGNKYKLEIAGQDIFSDGKTRWTYLKDANEVQIDNIKTDENSITPSNIFTMYEKGWQFKFNGEQTTKGMVYQLVELIPIDPKKKNIFKVKLTINKSDKFISTAEVFNKNGSIQTITVDKFSPDTVNGDSLFSFSASKISGS